MAAWWKPTTEGYFHCIAKPALLEAVSQFAPSHVNRQAKLKKADIASEAERLADGTNWMPAWFQIDHRTEPESPLATGKMDSSDDVFNCETIHVCSA